MQTPDFPAGPPPESPTETPLTLSADERNTLIETLAAQPAIYRAAVADLDDAALATKYRRWTIRQIVHHVADSHANILQRFKLALTEDRPTIRPYDEDPVAFLPDSVHGDIESALDMIAGIHGRWVVLLNHMSDADFAREFFHPEHQQSFSLNWALGSYTWHGGHHAAQIAWLRENRLS